MPLAQSVIRIHHALLQLLQKHSIFMIKNRQNTYSNHLASRNVTLKAHISVTMTYLSLKLLKPSVSGNRCTLTALRFADLTSPIALETYEQITQDKTMHTN